MYRNVFCGQTWVVAVWLTHQLAPLLHLCIVETVSHQCHCFNKEEAETWLSSYQHGEIVW